MTQRRKRCSHLDLFAGPSRRVLPTSRPAQRVPRRVRYSRRSHAVYYSELIRCRPCRRRQYTPHHRHSSSSLRTRLLLSPPPPMHGLEGRRRLAPSRRRPPRRRAPHRAPAQVDSGRRLQLSRPRLAESSGRLHRSPEVASSLLPLPIQPSPTPVMPGSRPAPLEPRPTVPGPLPVPAPPGRLPSPPGPLPVPVPPGPLPSPPWSPAAALMFLAYQRVPALVFPTVAPPPPRGTPRRSPLPVSRSPRLFPPTKHRCPGRPLKHPGPPPALDRRPRHIPGCQAVRPNRLGQLSEQHRRPQ